MIKIPLFSFVILYFLLESGLIFLMYRIQDSIGPEAVFHIIHTTYALFDMATMVTDANVIREAIHYHTQRKNF